MPATIVAFLALFLGFVASNAALGQDAASPAPARSLILEVSGSAQARQAFKQALGLLEGAEQALIIQDRRTQSAADTFVVDLIDPHAGGQALFAVASCLLGPDCSPHEPPTGAYLLTRSASPSALAETLRRALSGFASNGQASTNLSLPELLTYTSRNLRAPLRRPEAVDLVYSIDISNFSPAAIDLEAAAYERLIALSLLQSNDPLAVQDHLQSCRFCQERDALNAHMLTLLTNDASAENLLSQWQAVVASASPQAAFGFLQSYPNSPISKTIIADVAQTWPDQLAAVEAKLWADAVELADTNTMRSLILACEDCGFAEALDRQVLRGSNPELDDETQLWQQARLENTTQSYARYLNDCTLCLFSPEALRQQQIAGPDPAALNDRKLLARIEVEANIQTWSDYLSGCQLCEQREAIQTTLDLALKADTAQTNCLDLARSPDAGGNGLHVQEAPAAEEACLLALEQEDSQAARLVLAEAYRLQGKADLAVQTFDSALKASEASAADGLALSLFQFSKAGSEGRRRLADLIATPGLQEQSPRRALVEALIAIEQLSASDRLRPQPEIVALLEAAAAGHEADAHYTLGLLYSFGQMAERDLSKAAQAFQNATALGHVEASAYYADHVERGLGVAADYQLAATLFYQALKDNSNWASTRLIDQGRSRPLEVMKHIQRFLREDGLYRGPIDGVAGSTTVKALTKARDKG